jgi:hypothetical protein
MIVLYHEKRWWRPYVVQDGIDIILTQEEVNKIELRNTRIEQTYQTHASEFEVAVMGTRDGPQNLSERLSNVTEIRFDEMEPFVDVFMMGGFHERVGGNSWLYKVAREDLQTIFRGVFN